MSYRLSLSRMLAGLALAAALSSSPAWAIRPDEMLANPALEARARAIGRELRCLVCQNESIDDSEADLAHDLRLLVRHRLEAGDTDEQVKQYIVARYGTYVLLKPPFVAETYLLWFGPLILLLGAAGTAIVFHRRSARAPEPAPISEDQKQRLAELIGRDDSDSKGA